MKKATFNTLLVGGGSCWEPQASRRLRVRPQRRPMCMASHAACVQRTAIRIWLNQAKPKSTIWSPKATYLTSDAKAAKADSEPSAE